MEMDISAMDRIQERVNGWSRRSSAPQKIGPEVDRMMAETLKKQMRRKPVGEMNRLGPSLIDVNHPDHIFQSQRVGAGYVFTIGTKLKYSYPYRAWRKSKGMKSHFRAMPSFRKKVGKKMADYILDGTT